MASQNFTLAISELTRLHEEFQVKEDGLPERAVRLFNLARLFVDDPLISQTAMEVVKSRDAANATNIDRVCAQRFSGELKGQLQSLATRFGDAIEDNRRSPKSTMLVALEAPLKNQVQWQGRPSSVLDVFWWLKTREDWSTLTLGEIEAAAEKVLPQAIAFIRNILPQQKDNPTWNDISNDLQAAYHATGNLYRSLYAMSLTCQATSVTSTFETLTAYYIGLNEILNGHHNPESRFHSIHSDIDAHRAKIDRLVSATRARLALGPVQSHAIVRLKTYLERFAKGAILEAVAAAARSNEKIIQETMDRFLFGEGLFPVTQAQAAGGKIDTLAIDTAAIDTLLSEARDTHQPAILIELKQALSGSKDSIGSAVDQARHQVTEYSNHIAANPHWANHQVFGIVVYSSPKRFRTVHKDVVLVYLGDAPPSDKSESLDE